MLKTTDYNEILERYQQDFIMIKQLSETVDLERGIVLMNLAEEKLRDIAMIKEFIKRRKCC